ncbi:MAG: sensor histidine kinase [Betaproteobacteria bacterium]|nr:MAG: sensor histidine kinase [Betaproteobacteria bacterium]
MAVTGQQIRSAARGVSRDAARASTRESTSWQGNAKTSEVDQTDLRLLRLLALYRAVVGVALAVLAAGTDARVETYAAAFAYAAWALVSLFTFQRFKGRIPSLLLVQLTIDLALIAFVLITTQTRITAYAAYLFPIAAAHGWFFRSRIAFAHAAFAAMVLLVAEWFVRDVSVSGVTQAAVVGAGYFLMTAVGMLLGGSAASSEELAISRSEDIRRLAQVNQMVISELSDGVLAVNADGQVIMSNPRARRWLTGDEATMRPQLHIDDVSITLSQRWRSFVQHGSTVDGSPITVSVGPRGEGETGIAKSKVLLPRFMPIDVQQDGGTIIFLEDLDQAQAEAQQIKLAALGRLSASIAHEIRNPLSAIKQAAQLLGEEVQGSEQAMSLSRIIDKNTERIDRIVRDVSLLGRRDRGTPEMLSLPNMAKECIQELIPHINAHGGYQLSATSDVYVKVDKSHLEEMLNNLLSNAWRHSRKNRGSVRVSVGSNFETQRAIIQVHDDGDGVPKNVIDKIFEPFFSGSGSTGLGLYLVRELAQAAGGNVRLGQSTTGARFVLELPLAIVKNPG